MRGAFSACLFPRTRNPYSWSNKVKGPGLTIEVSGNHRAVEATLLARAATEATEEATEATEG